MISFAVAVFFLIVTPGPGVLSAAGMGASFGFRPGLRYLVGLIIGTNLVALAVVSGVAALILSLPHARTVLLFASGAYLLYLAARIAFSGNKVAFIETERAPGILGGIVLQTINPKAYAVNTALFTGFAFWPESLLVEMLIKFAIMNAICIPIYLLWMAAGVSIKKLALSERAQFTMNIGMALAMLAVVLLAINS